MWRARLNPPLQPPASPARISLKGASAALPDRDHERATVWRFWLGDDAAFQRTLLDSGVIAPVAHGEDVIKLLRDAAHQRGATVLIVAHDARIIPFADRVFYLEDGRLQDGEDEALPGPNPPGRQYLHQSPTTEAPASLGSGH